MLAFGAAVAAIGYLELRDRQKLAAIADTELERIHELLGIVTVDGKLTAAERRSCEIASQLVEQLPENPFEKFTFCANNPRDAKCEAVHTLEKCRTEKWFDDLDIEDNPVWDGIVNLPGKLGDAIGGAIGGIFGNVAWVIAAGGLAYLVLVHK